MEPKDIVQAVTAIIQAVAAIVTIGLTAFTAGMLYSTTKLATGEAAQRRAEEQRRQALLLREALAQADHGLDALAAAGGPRADLLADISDRLQAIPGAGAPTLELGEAVIALRSAFEAARHVVIGARYGPEADALLHARNALARGIGQPER